MKKSICVMLSMLWIVFSLTACVTNNNQKTTEEKETQNTESTNTVVNDEDVLVVYFSETGTTKNIAEKIANQLSADTYEIVPANPYTDEDLNYNDKNTRATVEQNDASARPEMSGTIENWDKYEVVLIGHPIWWGEEPRILDTFVESYDFNGKKISTFCTSGSSGLGDSEKHLEDLANGGTWFDGKRFSGNASEGDISSWLSDIGLIE